MEDAEDPLAPRPSDYAFMKSKQFKTYERYQFSTANNKDHAKEVKEDKKEFLYLIRKVTPTDNKVVENRGDNRGSSLVATLDTYGLESLLVKVYLPYRLSALFSPEFVQNYNLLYTSLTHGASFREEERDTDRRIDGSHKIKNEEGASFHRSPPKIEPTSSLIIDSIFSLDDDNITDCNHSSLLNDNNPPNIGLTSDAGESLVDSKLDERDCNKPQEHLLKSRQETVHFLCHLCGYETKNKNNLIQHINSKHNQKEPYKCDLCDYTSLRRISMTAHRDAIHLGLKKFSCHLCGDKVQHECHLNAAINSNHSQNKLFLCDLCDFIAVTKKKLTRHKNRDHNGIKPFSCRFCDYQTRDKIKLKQHKNSKHDQNHMGTLFFSGELI